MNPLLKPPKRRVVADGIPLNDVENDRFLRFIAQKGWTSLLERFVEESGLYLRGRCDGPRGSGTDPCGYLFISEDSFDRGHRAIVFLDPAPKNTPLKASFYQWKPLLPFDQEEWEKLPIDRLQYKNRAMILKPPSELDRAVRFARTAVARFSAAFDLTHRHPE